MNMTDPIQIFMQSFSTNYLVVFVGAIGLILLTFLASRDIIRSSYDFLRRNRIKAEQEYLEHCDSLFKQFVPAFDKLYTQNNNRPSLKKFLNSFTYKDQFLRHLFTGYDEVFTDLVSVINTENDQLPTYQLSQWLESRKKFKISFTNFTKSIILKNKKFGGVCEDCKDNYEKAYKTTEMSEKLKSFSGIP